jgi:hypothetical protein
VLGRVEVEADNVLDLGHEVGIAREFEGSRQMRLEPVRLPDFLHRRRRNFYPRRHRAHAPMRGIGRLLVEREADHLLDLPCRQRLAPRRAGGIFQQPVYAVRRISPAPASHREHDLARPRAVASQHHNPRPPHYLLRRIAVSHQFFQLLPIFWSNLNAFDLAHRARIAFLPGFGNHPMRTEH